jgi:hypothetical protein
MASKPLAWGCRTLSTAAQHTKAFRWTGPVQGRTPAGQTAQPPGLRICRVLHRECSKMPCRRRCVSMFLQHRYWPPSRTPECRQQVEENASIVQRHTQKHCLEALLPPGQSTVGPNPAGFRESGELAPEGCRMHRRGCVCRGVPAARLLAQRNGERQYGFYVFSNSRS